MPKLIDLTGKTFGRLTVIQRDFSKSSRKAMWLCYCKCGKEVVVSGDHLRSGHSKSCGCLQREKAAITMKDIQELGTAAITKDLSNHRYGLLTVLEYSHTNNQKRFWKCQCDCGNITYVSTSDLITGHTSSCGCLKSSRGEYEIEKLLKENGLTFIKEKTFDGCIDKIKLRFDFYVNNSYLIEFDGRQHFESIPEWGGDITLIETQRRDAIKNNYCFNNNIPLIRIPYTHLNDLAFEDLLLEKTKYRVV